ncbi:hypothetical protein KC330_g4633 [Hortaea werneckii]|nr:hypothetical protein KC330_g4633 [Hortaea werneckii]
MDNVCYITSSAEMEMLLNDQQEEMRNAMANILKATKAGIPLHDFWTTKQIFEKPSAIAAYGCNTVNGKIVWEKDTRVPLLQDFTTTSTAYRIGVPMHMVKHSDARMTTTLISQEGYDLALEGALDQFVPLRRLSNGLVPFVGLQVLRALPFKLHLDEEFYDMQARRETQRQTLESVLHNLKVNDNSKIINSFVQTVDDILGPRARLGPFLDSEEINASSPAIYTTYPTNHNIFIPSNSSMDMMAELGYDKRSEGALLCRLTDDEQSNARWMGTEDAKQAYNQDSTHENPQNQSSPQAEQPGKDSSNTEHAEGQPIAGKSDGEPEETISPDPALTQAAASPQPANTTTSRCMLPKCPRPMTRAEVRRTHLVTHYAKWHGMPAVKRVYGGDWSASNDAQDAIIVPWLQGLGVDPASIKLNGEVVFKG